MAGAEDRLGEAVRRTAARGGKVLIPAFALGRVQEIVYASTSCTAPARSPTCRSTSTARSRWTRRPCSGCTPRCSTTASAWSRTRCRLFDFSLVHYVRDVAASKALNDLPGPAIIIAASGMAESGRILHHLANGIGDHRNLVLFVGYQAEHTLGRRIQDGDEIVRIMGQDYPRRAEVETIGGYSAHADRTELRAWVRRLGGPIRRAFVVHGETAALGAMAAILKDEGVREVIQPKHGEAFDL